MDSNAIPIGESTTVIVKVSGDLFLQGGDQPEARFQSSEDRIRVNQSNDTLYVETHASMDLTLPRSSSVIVEKVGGSAFIEDLDSNLMVQKVGGDLAMQRLNIVRIDKVGGSCMIQDVNGAIEINKIGGDMVLRQARGPVEIGTIGGEGDLQTLGEAPLTARTGGDLRLYLTETVHAHISVRAGGEVEIYLPSQAPASLRLTSDSEYIQLHLAGQTQEIENRYYEAEIGEGGSPIEARSGGNMRMSDAAAEPRSITDELERRENAWIESRDRRGHASWSGGFGFDRSSAWAEMISRRAQEAARRAEQRAQAAMRRTEEQIRMAAEREMRRQGFHGEHIHHPTPPPSPSEPVTEKERMLVLEMLREQKISVEQAEKLLAALEGRFDRS